MVDREREGRQALLSNLAAVTSGALPRHCVAVLFVARMTHSVYSVESGSL